MTLLSKSTYLMGLQCPKLLWHRYNAKEELPVADEAQQAIFDQGHEVGAWAKRLYPDGIEVGEGVVELKVVAARTHQQLPKHKPLFEAAFLTTTCYARADILVPVGRNQWDVVEVKSSTKSKDINSHDLAFQRHVYESAGLKIRKTLLTHLNSDYVRRGAIEPEKLLTTTDLTDEVVELCVDVPRKVAEMRAVIDGKQFPAVPIGKQCADPYPCPLTEKCWGFLPDHSVMDLYSGKQKGFALINQGIVKLADIPDTVKLTDRQALQRSVIRTGKPHVDRQAIRSFLATLQYPLSFLDFETINSAVPQFDDSKPYQQIPFQFSLHVVEAEGAVPRHCKFLHPDRSDPRPSFIEQLRRDLPSTGSVVVFNASFEKSRLKECVELLPSFSPWWKKVESRIVDLLDPFRAFDFYHADQRGSASIKAVLPVMTGSGYEQLAIQDGGTASREYLAAVFGKMAAGERSRIFSQLDDYCGLDTRGMIGIVEALRKVVRTA
jgi:hypothetical protein